MHKAVLNKLDKLSLKGKELQKRREKIQADYKLEKVDIMPMSKNKMRLMNKYFKLNCEVDNEFEELDYEISEIRESPEMIKISEIANAVKTLKGYGLM